MRPGNIDDSEWEDFETELKRYRRIHDEFEISERVYPMVGTGIQPMVSDVTVRNRRTGAERLYHAGQSSSWVAEFARDLAAHVL